jgi:hypothetical protein
MSGLTLEPRAALLVVLHNHTDDEAGVILLVERSCLQHDTQAVNEGHDSHRRFERRSLCERHTTIELESIIA